MFCRLTDKRQNKIPLIFAHTQFALIFSKMNATQTLVKLTPANASQYIGHQIQFKTRKTTITKTILRVSETGKTIYIDHPDLNNCLEIVSRNVSVIL